MGIGNGSRARPVDEEGSVDKMDEASRLTGHDERALEGICRQLDMEFPHLSGQPEPARPATWGAGGHGDQEQKRRTSNRARRSRPVVGTLLLLACAVGGAAGTRAIILHLKSADSPATARREVPQPRPETAAPASPAEAPTPSPPIPPVTRTSPLASRTRPQAALGAAKPTTTRQNSAAKDAPAREKSRLAGQLRERPVQPDQLRVAATRPMSAPASSVRSYWVQVGAFTNPEAAQRLASLLREQEPRSSTKRWVVVMEPVSTGTPRACVRVGPFSDQAVAASKLREFRARGYEPSIAQEHD